MVGRSKFSDKELEFRKELQRRRALIKKKYGYHVEGGTWGGICETIEKTDPYLRIKQN